VVLDVDKEVLPFSIDRARKWSKSLIDYYSTEHVNTNLSLTTVIEHALMGLENTHRRLFHTSESG
jgi:hypothetical protein